MIKLKDILNEIVLEDYSYEDTYSEVIDDIRTYMFNYFLYKNNSDMTKNIPWKVIPFNMLKETWEDFMKYGYVRKEHELEEIASLITYNSFKVLILTELSGHTSYHPYDEYEESFSYYIDNFLLYKHTRNLNIPKNQLSFKFYKKLKFEKIENKYLDDIIDSKGLVDDSDDIVKPILIEALKERFYDYFMEGKYSGNQAYISDYALKPIMQLVRQLNTTKNLEDKLVYADRILNIVHQRSDIASWYVQGGKDSLSKLSGTVDDEKEKEEND
jgi:hypothetical protein